MTSGAGTFFWPDLDLTWQKLIKNSPGREGAPPPLPEKGGALPPGGRPPLGSEIFFAKSSQGQAKKKIVPAPHVMSRLLRDKKKNPAEGVPSALE